MIRLRQKVAQAIGEEKHIEEQVTGLHSKSRPTQLQLEKIRRKTVLLREKLAMMEAKVQRCYVEKQVFLAVSKCEAAEAKIKQAAAKFEASLSRFRQTETDFRSNSTSSSESKSSSVHFDDLLEKYGRLVGDREEQAEFAGERSSQFEESEESLALELSELNELSNSFSVWIQDLSEAIDESAAHETALQRRIDALLSECKALDECSGAGTSSMSSRDAVNHQAQVTLNRELTKAMTEERDQVSVATATLRKALRYLQLMQIRIASRLFALKNPE